MILKKLLIGCLLLSFITIQAQNKVIDSLIIVLQNHKKNDSTKVDLLNDVAYEIGEFNYTKADSLLQLALSLSLDLNYETGKAHGLYTFAIIELEQSNYKKAIFNYNLALDLYRNQENKTGISYALNGIGIAHYEQGNYDEALKYYEQSLAIDLERNDLGDIAGSYNNIANIYADKGDYDKAIDYYTNAKNIKSEINDSHGVALCLNNIGSVFKEKGDFSRALEFHNKALMIYEETQNILKKTSVLNNIGNIYKSQNDLDKALFYFKKALEINKTKGNKKQIVACLNDIGSIHKEKSNYDEASNFYDEALSICKEINDNIELPEIYNNLAEVAFLTRKSDLALMYFNRALSGYKQKGIKYGTSKSLIGLANVYSLNNNIPKALEYAFEGQKIAKDLGLLKEQRDVLKLISTLHKKQNNFSSALESHEQYKALSDSLFNKKNIQKIAQLEYEYEYKSKLDSANTREIHLKQKVLSANEDLRKTRLNYLLLIIGLLVIIIVSGSAAFYLKLNNQKNKVKAMEVEQRLLRSQMTPHFVFNSLSVLQGIILNNESNKAVNYISKFSRLLRTILESTRDKMVSIDLELKAIENYLALQNMDVNLPYIYRLNIDESINTKTFHIPPMLIQPFIENAIEHAFSDKNKDKIIDVGLKLSEKNLICTIKDNGSGLQANQKTNLNKKSLATLITSERLEILSKDYKTKACLTVEDCKKHGQQGTLVTLTIPYKIVNR